MKKLIVLAFSVLLSSCFSAKEVTEDYTLPKGLADCSVHQLGDTTKRILVVRCPNSSTTVNAGSKSTNVTVVED